MIEVKCYNSSDGWVFLFTPGIKISPVLPQKKKKKIAINIGGDTDINTDIRATI